MGVTYSVGVDIFDIVKNILNIRNKNLTKSQIDVLNEFKAYIHEKSKEKAIDSEIKLEKLRRIRFENDNIIKSFTESSNNDVIEMEKTMKKQRLLEGIEQYKKISRCLNKDLQK